MFIHVYVYILPFSQLSYDSIHLAKLPQMHVPHQGYILSKNALICFFLPGQDCGVIIKKVFPLGHFTLLGAILCGPGEVSGPHPLPSASAPK